MLLNLYVNDRQLVSELLHVPKLCVSVYFVLGLQLQNLERAYEDMSLAGKREEERMKRVDPMKAQQAERLGMGLGMRT